MEESLVGDTELAGGAGRASKMNAAKRPEEELKFEDCDEFIGGNPALGEADASGRLSRGSGGESAFSSASESDESGSQLDGSASERRHSCASSTSGRSSADDTQADDALAPGPQLNKICNLVPESAPISRQVDQIRLRFLELIESKTSEQLADEYEPEDLAELRKPLPAPQQQEQSLAFRMISRFIHYKLLADFKEDTLDRKAQDELLEKLDGLLLFRRQYRLARVLPDQFCQEILMLCGIFPFGVDRNNLPVMYLRARAHRRWSASLDETFRRYVAWRVNEITKTYAGAAVAKTVGARGIEKDGSFGICFDCLNVSYSCVDMDFLRFLVKVLVNHYPTYCRYSLCVDLPWLFRSVWKLVKTWLPEEAQNTVQLITSKQLVEYISEDQIPNSIKYNDDLLAGDKSPANKHPLPENFASIRKVDAMADELNLSSSERKQFKAHIQKVLKEYEQLGA